MGQLVQATGRTAAGEGYGEVGTPIILLVLIIVLAFIPIFTMKGAEKQIFSPMAKTYTYALFFTLLLTFTYLAAAIHTFLEGHEGKEFRFFETIQNCYVKLMNSLFLRTPNGRYRSFLVILIAGFGVGFQRIGTQFLPKMDEGNLYIRITFPYSIALSKTHENAKKVRDVLMQFPEIKTWPCGWEGRRTGPRPPAPSIASIMSDLKPTASGRGELRKSNWKRRYGED